MNFFAKRYCRVFQTVFRKALPVLSYREPEIIRSCAEIGKEDIPSLAKHAAREANPLYPVPKRMTTKELEQFYYQVADWS